MHECHPPGSLMKAQWCRSCYHSLHLCHLFCSWTPAILTDLCANRWHLYGKSWDVLLYGMDNALAQATRGSSSLFFSTSRSLFLFQHLSWFLLSYFYTLFVLIKNSFQCINLNILRPYPEKKYPSLLFFLYQSMSITAYKTTVALTKCIIMPMQWAMKRKHALPMELLLHQSNTIWVKQCMQGHKPRTIIAFTLHYINYIT